MAWIKTGNIRGPVPPLSTATPQPLGAAAAGTGINVSREDHQHPDSVAKLGVTGLTGVGAGRLVGGNTTGLPPTTGDFLADDWMPDLLHGGIWICLQSGNPGNWINPTPWGEIAASTPVTAAQGGIVGGFVDLTGVSVSPVLQNNRRYRVTAGGFGCSSNIANDTYQVGLSIGGTVQDNFRGPCGSAINNVNSSWKLCVPNVLGAGAAVTCKVVIQRATGTGTLTHAAGATDPSWLLVEDMGG